MFKIEKVPENDIHFKIFSVAHPDLFISLTRDDCDEDGMDVHLTSSGQAATLNINATRWIIKSSGVIENVKCKLVISMSDDDNDKRISLQQKMESDGDGWDQVRDIAH